MADGERDRDVLCVLVVGFHHQKGSQVEYSYPPPVSSLPLSWKFLPYAAIPDGAHRTDSGIQEQSANLHFIGTLSNIDI
jgi:hypothetical protein